MPINPARLPEEQNREQVAPDYIVARNAKDGRISESSFPVYRYGLREKGEDMETNVNILKSNRPMVHGIFTGAVRLNYAWHRHPL